MMNRTVEVIKNSQDIFIASHVGPDGDSLGSMLALGLALIEMGKKVTLLKADYIPKEFNFLPGIELIRDFKGSEAIDLLITVDSADEDRLGENKSLLKLAKNIINIDHHISNTNFGHINMVDGNASATGELIFDLIKTMGVEINKDIATCIYTAISTDTGSFKYESVTSKTHQIIAELIGAGIDKKFINNSLYANRSMEKTKLFIKSIATFKTYMDDKISIIKVTQDMLDDVGATMEDAEGIVSFIREIDTVEVAGLLKEIGPDEIRVSLRSKDYIDVSSICSKFNGGGHIRAAGCTIYNNIHKAEVSIIDEIKKAFR